MKAKTVQLDSLTVQIGRAEQFVTQRKEFDGLMSEKLFTSPQLDSLSNIAGFADRNRALGDLSYSANGKYDSNTAMAITFIGLLFIFFECLPVFVKLLSARGPYDHIIGNVETREILASDKDLEVETSVLENIHSTRIDTETSFRKERIMRDANKI